MPKINPWLNMWTCPRRSIRWIVDTNPQYGVFWLSSLYVLQFLFNLFNFWSLGLQFDHQALLIPSLLISPFLGGIWLCLYGKILQVIGKLFGGKAPPSHLKAALAWSKLPISLSLILWGGLWLHHPHEVFIQYGPSALAIIVIALRLALQGWTFILFVQTLREVQHFNIFQAFLSAFISWIFYFIFIFAIFLVIKPVSTYLSFISISFFN